MSSLVISLLIKEVVAAREVIADIVTPVSAKKLEKSLQNYYDTCHEIRKITEERITGPMSAYEQERKSIRRYE